MIFFLKQKKEINKNKTITKNKIIMLLNFDIFDPVHRTDIILVIEEDGKPFYSGGTVVLVQFEKVQFENK